MIIYKITNLINQKIYIGQHHKAACDGYFGSGTLIKRAIKKYGKENFSLIILKQNILKKDTLNAYEKFYIKFFNSTNKKIGYNIAKGGEGGDTLTHHPFKRIIIEKQQKTLRNTIIRKYGVSSVFSVPSIIEKSKQTKISNRTLIGRKHSNIDKNKCRTFQIDRSQEQREKIRKSNARGAGVILAPKKILTMPQRGHAISPISKEAFLLMCAKPKSENHKKELSKSLKKFWENNYPTNSVKVLVDGIEYNSLTEASEITKINLSTLRNRCKSKNPHFATTYRIDSPKMKMTV